MWGNGRNEESWRGFGERVNILAAAAYEMSKPIISFVSPFVKDAPKRGAIQTWENLGNVEMSKPGRYIGIRQRFSACQ